MIPGNWSERVYGRGWTACSFCSGLDVLEFGGVKFDESSVAIEQATVSTLETANGHVPGPTTMDELLANIKTVYGISLHESSNPYTSLLNSIGVGIVLFGKNGNLPVGDEWRRWDPTFTGIHSVAVFPRGNNESIVLDPEAPWGYTGDLVDNSKIEQWANGIGDYSYAHENEFATKFLRYEVVVEAGTYEVWHVQRYTHALVESRKVTFSRSSRAPVYHGIPGFWLVGLGGLSGWYFVNNHSILPFRIRKVFQSGDGSLSYQYVSPAG